jgi:imidazolonepropionase-like amidohydrolase
LLQAGVNVALKSDHPVIDARDLMGEAAKSHHYGVPEQQALQLVTRNPAIALGLIDRLGTLELGKDADVALWPGNPLQLGARPQRVFINGLQVVGDGENLQARWSGDAHPTGNVCGCGP